MQGWVQTVDGADVYEQDGWVWFPREQGWRWEPGLLTMPKAPLSERVNAEVERLSTDWPTLKQAWAWRGPYSGGMFIRAARVWVLGVAGYDLLHAVPLVRGTIAFTHDLPTYNGFHTLRESDLHIMGTAAFLGISTLFCLFAIWHNHVWMKDPHKGVLVAAALTAFAAWREHDRREQRHDGRRT